MNDTHPSRTELVSARTAKNIVADYTAGKKLRTIEERNSVSRSVIYRVLKDADVAPARVKQASRDNAGDSEATTTMLYKLVEQQDKRIRELEDQVRALKNSQA
jgi:hypothetical protein